MYVWIYCIDTNMSLIGYYQFIQVILHIMFVFGYIMCLKFLKMYSVFYVTYEINRVIIPSSRVGIYLLAHLWYTPCSYHTRGRVQACKKHF